MALSHGQDININLQQKFATRLLRRANQLTAQNLAIISQTHAESWQWLYEIRLLTKELLFRSMYAQLRHTAVNYRIPLWQGKRPSPRKQATKRIAILHNTAAMEMRKKSLLIGINYLGSDHQLNGCHRDVDNMAEFLSYRGYSSDPRSQVILRDDMGGMYYPSGHNMLVRNSKYSIFHVWVIDAR